MASDPPSDLTTCVAQAGKQPGPNVTLCVLKPEGSFVLNIGGSYNKGNRPARSIISNPHRARRVGRVLPRAGVLLVQPGQNARPGRMGHRTANRTGLRGIRLVALQDAVAQEANNRKVLEPTVKTWSD